MRIPLDAGRACVKYSSLQMPNTRAKKSAPDSASPRGRHEGAVPTYQKVVEDLRKRLDRDEWARGKALPSFRQLAAEYKVGVRVIRSALDVLKQEDRIEINARKRAVVKVQGYICTAINRAVALVLTNRLDMEVRNPDSSAVIKGIQMGVGKKCDPMLIVHDAKRTRDRLPPDLLDLPLGGILLYGTFLKEALDAYAELKIPALLVDRPSGSHPIGSVCVDNVQAAKDATRRLLEMGHRRIAFLRFVMLSIKDIDPDSKEREAGFRQAYEEARIPVPKDCVFNFFTRDKSSAGAFKALLDAQPKFTAAVCVDPHCALLIAEAAQARGIGIPRQLSIVCFHSNAQATTDWSGPRTDFEALGLRAMDVLGRRGPFCERVAAPWHEGKTIAPPPANPRTR